MKTVFRIFLRDLKRLSRNRAAALVMVGVCLLPSLYAWFNIAANMDPYGNTAGIKVAIANCDRGASSDIISLNAGDTIVQSLKKNDQLGWVFVDEKKAKEGVRSGKYYAAIVIPDDFSNSLLSVLSGEIKDPKLDYYINEKKNAIAAKITAHPRYPLKCIRSPYKIAENTAAKIDSVVMMIAALFGAVLCCPMLCSTK